MSEFFIPNEAEQLEAQEGYIRYLAGVAVLHNPDKTTHIHDLDATENLSEIVVAAENLMVAGLQKVIRLSHPEQHRSNLAGLEFRYYQALPAMRKTVRETFEMHPARVKELNPALAVLRPAAMVDELIYKHICHSRLYKLTTSRLMDNFPPATKIASFITERSLSSHRDLKLINPLIQDDAS